MINAAAGSSAPGARRRYAARPTPETQLYCTRTDGMPGSGRPKEMTR